MTLLKSELFKSSIIILLTLPSHLYAAESNQGGDDRGLTTSLFVQYYSDDNILRDETNIIDANVFVLAPSLQLIGGTGNYEFSFSLDGEIGKYEGSSEDNYNDTGISFGGDFQLASRHRLNLFASINNEHDERGNNFTQGRGGDLTQVDEFQSKNASAIYTFGRQEAKGQLNFALSNTNIDYDSRVENNIDLTSFRDRNDLLASIIFNYAITAKTNLIATYTNVDVEYDANSNLNSSEDAILVGVSWQGTAKTTGSIEFGYRDRRLDDGSSDDESATWEIGILWEPLSYSSVNFTSNKMTEESIGIGNFRTVTSTGVSWVHNWSSRISSDLSYLNTETDFDGINITDDTTTIQASLNYVIGNNMDLSFYYTNSDRSTSSDLLPFNYDREIIGLSYMISF